jgi:hypothetical protein
MFERIDFYKRRCVRTVIDVVEQVPGRWFARPPMLLNESSVGLLLLWSWLRFESDFLTRCLEDLGVDLGSLTQQVDALLKERTIPNDSPATPDWSPGNPLAAKVLREWSAAWLDRAAEESRSLNQGYLGMEHLLLAFLRVKGTPFALLFSQFGIDHRRLMNAVFEAIQRRQSTKDKPVDIVAFDLDSTELWQEEQPRKPAAGMPKRFSMAIMMSWVTLFAMVFSLLQWLGTPPMLFGIITVLMFLVGIGQMWLFGGKQPREASIWTGAVVLSAEVFILNIATGYFSSPHSSIAQRIGESVFGIILCVPLGAFFGYLLGGLTAGIVLVLDYLEKRKTDKEMAEAEKNCDNVTLVE